MLDKLTQAIEQLVIATGHRLDEPDFANTPQRVAKLWADEFLSGYQMDAQTILQNPVLGEPDPDVVTLNDISFHSMCPHHLLPYQGQAHIAYIPKGRLLGFGRIAQLVACFTQRLTLQERATHQIAEALLTHLPCQGAACVLQATQLCLGIPTDRHNHNRELTTSFVGDFKTRPDLQTTFLNRIG